MKLSREEYEALLEAVNYTIAMNKPRELRTPPNPEPLGMVRKKIFLAYCQKINSENDKCISHENKNVDF